MTSLDKLDLIRTIATKNYARCTVKELTETLIGTEDEILLKETLIDMLVSQDIKGRITEPALTENWARQVDECLAMVQE
jgi:hypothetical protein